LLGVKVCNSLGPREEPTPRGASQAESVTHLVD
jgi:hypothetical protein